MGSKYKQQLLSATAKGWWPTMRPFSLPVAPGSKKSPFRPVVLAVVVGITTCVTVKGSPVTPVMTSADTVLEPGFELKPVQAGIWDTTVGNGFKAGLQSVSINLGAGYGVEILGSTQSHDLALMSLSYGRMIGSVEGADHWYHGNWEFRGELFTGAQFSPSAESLVGIAPHLRYNFATGSRWVPYVDIGAGVSATSIGPPDLSGTFEFNLQAATGVRWFIRDNVALNIEARYLHMSCAGIHPPNLGLNNAVGLAGITWFF